MSSAAPEAASGEIIMVIKTSSLEVDDRLRKEIQSARKLGFEVFVHCLLDEDKRVSGKTWGDAGYQSHRLWSRRICSGHRFVWLHVLEFALRLLLSSNGLMANRPKSSVRRVLWLHDPVLMPVVPLAALSRAVGRADSVVWDQHELPPEGWIRRSPFRALLKWVCRLPDHLICANAARVGYLKSKGIVASDRDVLVLNNFSDSDYSSQPVESLDDSLFAWLQGERYLLLQGGGSTLRHVESVLDAVLSNRWPALKVVMVGGYDKGIVTAFRKRDPELFDSLIWRQGTVPQMELARYADHACGSLILYRANSPNQVYCEPNRLYQALCRGVPVIVGSNPPMADVVKSTGAGLVLDDDGQDAFGIVAAVRTLLASPDYAEAARRSRDRFDWKAQSRVIEIALDVRSAGPETVNV